MKQVQHPQCICSPNPTSAFRIISHATLVMSSRDVLGAVTPFSGEWIGHQAVISYLLIANLGPKML